uniref:BTB domain-containing protein n=1 Tax=Arcella intermedia TaxID=1963864 RepID=A0A6B2L4D1_9EUKA
MIEMQLRFATHVMLTFSLTDPASLEKVLEYHQLMTHLKEEYGASPRVLLVGTKSDLKEERRVTQEEGQGVADRMGCAYFEVSSKLEENNNVDKAFKWLISIGEMQNVPPFVEKDGVMGSTLGSDMDRLFNSPILSDLKFVCEDKTVYLHKVIISIRFPPFIDKFFTKSNTYNCTKVPYEDVLVLTRWIYTGSLVHPHPESLRQSIISLQLFPLIQQLSTMNDTVPNTPLPTFGVILNQKSLSDITLIVGNSNFFAHQQILYCRSSYFKSMFQSGFKESLSNDLIINIKETSPKTFCEVLEYIYTDIVEVNEKNWQNLLDSSLIFGIEGLTRTVERFLIQNTTIDNVVSLFTLCKEYPLPYLNDKLKYVIGYYFPLIIQTKSFKALNQNVQQELSKLKIEGTWRIEQGKKENCSLQ